MVRVPQVDNLEALSVMLLTSVQTFGSFGLGDYDCGFTCPDVLQDLNPPTAGDGIEFEYMLGEKPGFQYRLHKGEGGSHRLR